MIHVIREYQPEQDTPSLRDCIVELQEFERRIELSENLKGGLYEPT
jgi:hypothetical protein